MQITIIAGGSREDVQPYVALGQGLQEAGHRVHLLTSDDFETLVTDHGLAFFTTGGSAETVAREMQTLSEQGNMLKILSEMRHASEKQAVQAASKGLTACQGSDLILGRLSGLFSGQALSEKLSIPLLLAYLVPFTPTSAFPSVLTPLPRTPLTHWMNRPSHHMAQQTMWQSFRSADHKARAEVLHVPPAPFWGPFSSLRHQKQPILYGYSSHMLRHPSDWDDAQHVTGYWFLEPSPGWEPPADLLAFLQAGPPPIYIGFGSMASRKPEEAADLVLQALARTGQRGVLYEGWGGLRKEQLPETVYMTRSIPHTWLFPRALWPHQQSAIADKQIPVKHLHYERIETYFGAFLTDFVAFFIVICTGATLFVHHIQITQAQDAALALVPLVGGNGHFAEILFGIGLLNASLMAASVLPLSTAYSVLVGSAESGAPSRGTPIFVALYWDYCRGGRYYAVCSQ